jgi:hypothetical protein
LLLSEQSTPLFREAKRQNDWNLFERGMSALNRRYEDAYKNFFFDEECAKWWRRAKGLLRRMLPW